MPTYAIKQATGFLYKCPHGGKWTVANVSPHTKALDVNYEVVFTGATLTPSPVCPATPPTHGVPACVHVSVIAVPSSVLKLSVTVGATLATGVQLSTSNGIPATLESGAESTNVEE